MKMGQVHLMNKGVMAVMSRKSGQKPLKDIIAIFVEGPTEKEYFTQLVQQKNLGGATALRVDVLSGSGDYVDKAENHIKSSSKYKNTNITKKILVFDTNHKNATLLQQLFSKAGKKGYEIAFSNASFEVWLLAHFNLMTPKITSESNLEDKLSACLKAKYKKGNSNQIAKIIKGLEKAFQNTSNINNKATNQQSTTVGVIIKSLL